jgi:hypothetical protein
MAGAADELAEGVRVGAGGLLEQPVEQQPPGSGGPPVEPEGELVEVVGQVVAADPVVQGAGCEVPPLSWRLSILV